MHWYGTKLYMGICNKGKKRIKRAITTAQLKSREKRLSIVKEKGQLSKYVLSFDLWQLTFDNFYLPGRCARKLSVIIELMKIICLLTGILISIIQSVALGQTFHEYSEFKPEQSNLDIKIDGFNVSEAFKLSNSSILIFGRSTNLFHSNIGIIQYDTLRNVMIHKNFNYLFHKGSSY